MIFVKLNNYWWELEGRRVYNISGGHHFIDYYEENNLIEDKVEVEDWEYLDWKDTSLWNNKEKTGWIDREGVFYGCESECHSRQAQLVHKKSERELEILGWVKIIDSMYSRKCENGLSFLNVKHGITKKQYLKLLEKGFKEEEIERRGKTI